MNGLLALCCSSLLIGTNYFCYSVYSFIAKDRQTAKSLVIGRPILLALEDIDGTPSFLEKALRFLEEHGEALVLLIFFKIKEKDFID